MTPTFEPIETPVRLDFDAHAPAFSRAMARLDDAATKELERVEFDPRLRELVRIRASQLNGCAYCIEMHAKDARAIGETEQRIYALPVWREAPFFSPRERAVLAFTETVTRLSETHVPQEAFDEVAAELSPAEIGALTSLLVTINAWNAISVSLRSWTPGSCQAEAVQDQGSRSGEGEPQCG
jgi:AhpD family alkylhydroperoxidase